MPYLRSVVYFHHCKKDIWLKQVTPPLRITVHEILKIDSHDIYQHCYPFFTCLPDPSSIYLEIVKQIYSIQLLNLFSNHPGYAYWHMFMPTFTSYFNFKLTFLSWMYLLKLKYLTKVFAPLTFCHFFTGSSITW